MLKIKTVHITSDAIN